MNLKYLLFFQTKQQTHIKNINYPNCKDCKYFKEDTDPYNKYHLSKCTFFGEKDIISGEITYKFTKTCRMSKDLCSNKGKFYIKN